ncbi:MAG: glutamate--tRNA ligase [Candidatus Daviesbacteria bacterium]|nr:glutamate--tRNA ligase [Candidatus Daviesbacteria bacterium]
MVRTRVAPSPTGYAHLGIVYQALFDFVFAHKYKGKFVLRIEDTDRSRFVEGAEEVIVESLKWANLLPDEGISKGGEYGPYRQSEKLELYQKHINELLKKGFAYHCFCTKERLDEMRKLKEQNHQAPKYDRTCLKLTDEEVKQNLAENISFVVRMKIPDNRIIVVDDAIAGKVEINSNELDDQVILKSDGYPTYHLAAVVDDYYMKITHIFRGTEWLPSTPKHILLWEYLGWQESMPKFAHLPLLLNSEGGGKLSKRQGHASVDYYRKEGFLPEAVVNYLANVVWNHPEGKEIFDAREFEKAFELEPFKVSVKSTGAKFDLAKLEWMNGEYIRKMSDSELTQRLQEFLIDHPAKGKIAPIVPLIKERIKKLSDFIPLTHFLFDDPEYEIEVFKKLKVENIKEVLGKVVEVLVGMKESWNAEKFEQSFRKLSEDLGIRSQDMFQLIRIAFSGQLVTPPLFDSMNIIGYNSSLERIKKVATSYPNFS